MAILVLGMGTIVYARQSQPEADASPPTINDHWHIAYGFMLCEPDNFTQLTGALEETDANGQLISDAFRRTGVHSHDDGVIHWHPSTSAAVGTRADLGRVPRRLRRRARRRLVAVPREPGRRGVHRGRDQVRRRGRRAQGRSSGTASRTPGSGTTYVSDFDDIRITNDGMAITIAFVPSGTDVTMPPWAANLPELGAVDTPPPDSVPPGDTVAPGATIAPGATTVPGAATGSTTPGRRRRPRRRRRRRRPHPPPPADAGRRPRRRVRHPPATADRQHPEVDAPGRPRPADRPPHRRARAGRGRRRHPRPRVPRRAVRRRRSRAAGAAGWPSTTPSSRNRSTPPARSASPPSTRPSTRRSWW